MLFLFRVEGADEAGVEGNGLYCCSCSNPSLTPSAKPSPLIGLQEQSPQQKSTRLIKGNFLPHFLSQAKSAMISNGRMPCIGKLTCFALLLRH
jgi:hypothetical protein